MGKVVHLPVDRKAAARARLDKALQARTERYAEMVAGQRAWREADDLVFSLHRELRALEEKG